MKFWRLKFEILFWNFQCNDFRFARFIKCFWYSLKKCWYAIYTTRDKCESMIHVPFSILLVASCFSRKLSFKMVWYNEHHCYFWVYFVNLFQNICCYFTLFYVLTPEQNAHSGPDRYCKTLINSELLARVKRHIKHLPPTSSRVYFPICAEINAGGDRRMLCCAGDTRRQICSLRALLTITLNTYLLDIFF